MSKSYEILWHSVLLTFAYEVTFTVLPLLATLISSPYVRESPQSYCALEDHKQIRMNTCMYAALSYTFNVCVTHKNTILQKRIITTETRPFIRMTTRHSQTETIFVTFCNIIVYIITTIISTIKQKILNNLIFLLFLRF